MYRVYKIKDIQHTGNEAPYGVSKVGEKYDRRRGKEFAIDLDLWEVGKPLILAPILFTTPYVKSWEDEDGFYIQTENSIYVCEIVYIPTEEERMSNAWFRERFYHGF